LMKADSLGVKRRAEGRRRVHRQTESGFGFGEARLIFFLRKCRVWLRVDVVLLPAAKPRGGIDFRAGQFPRGGRAGKELSFRSPSVARPLCCAGRQSGNQ
jgi:hypothetical protein